MGTTADYSVRVISIYATRWRYRAEAVFALPDDFDLGRLGEFYSLFKDQLPRLLAHETAEAVTFTRPGPDVDLAGVQTWLFALPSDQVVAALVADVRCPDLEGDPIGVLRVLDACAYADIAVGDSTVGEHFDALAQRVRAEEIPEGAPAGQAHWLPPERHQIVFAPPFPERILPREETIKRVLFRIDPPYREEFMQVEQPSGLNQEQRTLGAVTPYVSFLYGHQRYVENSAFLTAVQAVGTAARFRQIWYDASQRVSTFRRTKQAQDIGKQRREDMEELVDELGNFELDLSFSVETSADLGLLIPSLRIESYHRALYKVMELRTRANTVSQMFTRLDSSIRSEITAIDIREREESDRMRVIAAIGAAVLSFVGVLSSCLLAFFGINAREVDGALSMFDPRYLPVYLAAVGLAVLPGIVLALVFGRTWLRSRRATRRRESLDANAPSPPPIPRQRGDSAESRRAVTVSEQQLF